MTTFEWQIVTLVSLCWSCLYYLWINGCSDSIHLCSPQ